MFLCFGSSKKKLNKATVTKPLEGENIKDLERELKKLKDDVRELISDSENFRLQYYFIEDTVAQYKKIIIEINNNSEDDKIVEMIMKVLSKENFDLKQKFETLNGNVQMLKANENELYAKIEEMNDPMLNKIQQMELNNFTLQNLFIKKENEILNLEKFLRNLKNYKKVKNGHFEAEMYINNADIPLTNLFNNDPSSEMKTASNKEEDIGLRKILSEELEYSRGLYQRITKQTINQKTINQDNNRKIKEIKNEIELIKNPRPMMMKNMSNLSEMNSHTALNTMPSSLKGKEVLKLNENIPNSTTNNTSSHLRSNSVSHTLNVPPNEEILKQILDDLNLKQNTIQDLVIEIDQQKKANDKLENEISSLNNELSENFSLIFKLEMQLDKLKMKRKKRKVWDKNIQVHVKTNPYLNSAQEMENEIEHGKDQTN